MCLVIGIDSLLLDLISNNELKIYEDIVNLIANTLIHDYAIAVEAAELYPINQPPKLMAVFTNTVRTDLIIEHGIHRILRPCIPMLASLVSQGKFVRISVKQGDSYMRLILNE